MKWCDFTVWTGADMTVERIEFDANLWREMVRGLTAFYDRWLCPALVLCDRADDV